jgi:hypothetical protein
MFKTSDTIVDNVHGQIAHRLGSGIVRGDVVFHESLHFAARNKPFLAD